MRSGERGEGLVEVVVAAAILSMVIAAVMAGALAATHQFGAQSVDGALRHLVQRELRIAVDVLKYQGASIAPATVATTAPMPGASPIPVHVSIATTALTGGGYNVTISASADRTGETASLTTSIAQPAPLPSSSITAPANGQAPL